MNPITQTIKERDEIFNKRFGMLELDPDQRGISESIKSHNTQSHIALLESIVGVVESRVLPHDTDDEVSKWHFEKKGYNQALQDILTELQEALKELRDNEKSNDNT